MPNRNADLNRRSQVKSLVPWDGVSAAVWDEVLSGEAKCGEGAWRVVELATLQEFPFEARLTWTGGHGGNVSALVTVSRGTRVGVYAKSIQVLATNHVNGPNPVVCNIADSDSFVQTYNQYEIRGGLTAAGRGRTQQIFIPPFARYVRVLLADDTKLATTYIKTYDGQEILREITAVSAQPETGIPIGGVRTLELVSADDVDYRVVYDLSL